MVRFTLRRREDLDRREQSLRARRKARSRNGEGLRTEFVLNVFAQETADVKMYA